MDRSTARADEILESLKADVRSRVAARLLVIVEGDDDEDGPSYRGDEFLAALVNDFPFLDVAWDIDQLRALATSNPYGAAELARARPLEAADAKAVCDAGAEQAAEKASASASASAISGRTSSSPASSGASGGGRRSRSEAEMSGISNDADVPSPETPPEKCPAPTPPEMSPPTETETPEQRGTSGRAPRARACKPSRPPPPAAAKRKRKAKASTAVPDDDDDDRDDDYVPEDDGSVDDHILSAKKKPKKANASAEKTSGQGRNSAAWVQRMEQCRKFKQEHGHLRIPKKHPELGKWAKKMAAHQRKQAKSGNSEELSEGMQDKLRQLDEIGFSLESAFDRKLQEFLAFKQLNGHVKVPLKHPSLGWWVGGIRRVYNRMGRGEDPSPENSSIDLTLDRLRRLTEAGFLFQAQAPATPWEVRIEQLRKFKEENGHLRIPNSDPVLGNYAYDLRRMYKGTKKTSINPERRRILDEMGFCWSNMEGTPASRTPHKNRGKTKTWDEYFEAFKAYRVKHGHPYVPREGDGSDEAVRLGRWVAIQRQRYKNMKQGTNFKRNYPPLTTEKALKLSEAGFAWDASHIRRTPKDDNSGDDASTTNDSDEREALTWDC